MVDGMDLVMTDSDLASGAAALGEVGLRERLVGEGRNRAISSGLAADLARAIEQLVVPRLVLSHRVRTTQSAGLERDVRPVEVGHVEVERLADLLLAGDVLRAGYCVQRTLEGGANVETVYLRLLAPAARHLGLLWEEDRCDFTQVTVGVWQLRQILRELVPKFLGPAGAPRRDRRALLLAVPGEQHTFGIVMVAEFFRRAGWSVRSCPLGTPAETVGLVVWNLSWPAIIIRARLAGIGYAYEEAAADLGASRPWAIWRVLRPLLMPAIFASAVLVFAGTVDDFVIVEQLSSTAATQPMSVLIYSNVHGGLSGPSLNALATLMLVFSLVVAVVGFFVYRFLTRGDRQGAAGALTSIAGM